MKKELITVYTHDGIFHADEVITIALLDYTYTIDDVIRTRDKNVLKHAMNNPKAFVIDVGEDYNPDMRNFDHHQDLQVDATNVLVLMYLENESFISNELFNALTPMFLAISAWDKNAHDVHSRFENSIWKDSSNISILIAEFNRDPKSNYVAFQNAAYFAARILHNRINSIEMEFKAEETYNNRKALNSAVVIFDAYCGIWKNKESNYEYAIMPNPQGYALISRDSEKFPIQGIKNVEGLIFIHKSKFIAIFQGLEGAKEAGQIVSGVK